MLESLHTGEKPPHPLCERYITTSSFRVACQCVFLKKLYIYLRMWRSEKWFSGPRCFSYCPIFHFHNCCCWVNWKCGLYMLTATGGSANAVARALRFSLSLQGASRGAASRWEKCVLAPSPSSSSLLISVSVARDVLQISSLINSPSRDKILICWRFQKCALSVDQRPNLA